MGKLTTYRRMAQDTLDALALDGARPCRTASLPLLGAAPADVLRRLAPRPAGVLVQLSVEIVDMDRPSYVKEKLS